MIGRKSCRNCEKSENEERKTGSPSYKRKAPPVRGGALSWQRIADQRGFYSAPLSPRPSQQTAANHLAGDRPAKCVADQLRHAARRCAAVAKEDNFNFYYYDRGRREIAGASIKRPALGQWHRLRITAQGDRIKGWLNDQPLIDH